MQHPYLLDAELGVPVGDGLAELVRERVQHRVVRVNGGQAVLLELEKWIGQLRSILLGMFQVQNTVTRYIPHFYQDMRQGGTIESTRKSSSWVHNIGEIFIKE